MDPLCRMRGVRRSFVLHGQSLEVLRGVDLDVEPRDRIALTGASGAGKSTLLAILGLIDVAFLGTYRFDGRDVHEASALQRTQWRLGSLGFAFQDLHLVPSLTAQENVELPALAAGQSPAQAADRARELLSAAGLGPRTRHRPGQLSGGERRRVAFARALANQPRLLLMDEPTSELDEASTKGVLALIGKAMDEGAALVAATHDPRLQELCTTSYHLSDGTLRRTERAVRKK